MRDAKIGNLDSSVAVIGPQQIGRLDVAMYDALIVHYKDRLAPSICFHHKH